MSHPLYFLRVFVRVSIFATLILCTSAVDLAIAELRTPPPHALSPNEVLEDPPWRAGIHSINEMTLVITNRGVIGKPTTGYWEERDVFTGDVFRDGLVFPRSSRRTYLNALDLWIAGQTRLGPTVNSGVAYENFPQEGDMLALAPPGSITRRSITEQFGQPDPGAVSEEDLICDYGDSLMVTRPVESQFRVSDNPNSLGLAVHQESYAWSMGYAEDFVIVQMRVRNDGNRWLKNVFAGLHIAPAASLISIYLPSCTPNKLVCGLHRETPASFGCNHTDTLNIAWHANPSGSPYRGGWLEGRIWDQANECHWGSVRGAVGVMPLDLSEQVGPFHYNWWADVVSVETDTGWIVGSFEPSRDPAVPTCVPWYEPIDRDDERYRLLSNEEYDYPVYMAGVVAASDNGDWNRAPISTANLVAMGEVTGELLSWGPFGLSPGAEIPLIFAIVGGENLHVDPNNYLNLPHRPDLYEAGLDFSDLDKNALVARWIYDNPGVDTDDDGYFGEFRVCVRDSVLVGDQWVAQKADTQWYKGDGIPDFRGALPPPAPYVWVTPVHNGLHVRFNGQVSETEKDIFLQKPDFEGYRVYIGRDERVASLSVAASYDLEDYDKYRYNLSLEEPEWQLTNEPFSKDELRCLYGLTADPCNDSTFDPLVFTQMSPYRHPMYPNDSLFWFKPHDYNASTYGISTPITKTYPDLPDPRLLPADSITEDMYTEDGYLKFYEYECTIENILPTVSYWVNVTAFDYGSPAMGVTPMESDKDKGIIEAFPLHELDQPLSGSDNIFVYPNPYRTDAEYRDLGLEGRNQDDRWDERVRAIWFANLPPVCTIHIYTIDGDRVRTLDHNTVASDPLSRRRSWDLINRNYQKVESGLYYWVVEIPGDKTQVGKLAIIR